MNGTIRRGSLTQQQAATRLSERANVTPQEIIKLILPPQWRKQFLRPMTLSSKNQQP